MTGERSARDQADGVPADVPGLHIDKLTEYLSYRMPGRCRGEITARRLTTGLSNLTYEITETLTGRSWVLRRPPLTHVLPTAHDMRREYRVIRALYRAAGPRGEVPVPRPHLLCLDPSVIGSPFYVMAYVVGTTYRTPAQYATLTAEQARSMSLALVDTLAALHVIEPRTVGLADFGHPDGFLRRQLERWDRQYAASANREIPGMSKLSAGLADRTPKSRHVAILHGDFRPDNVIFSPGSTDTVAAVLDWEMSTLGDPLADLGLLLTYWDGVQADALTNADEWAAMPLHGRGLPTRQGFLSTDEVVAAYTERTGIRADDMAWYLAFSHYKLAVILEGIYYRHTQGSSYGGGFDDAGDVVRALVAAGLEHLARSRR